MRSNCALSRVGSRPARKRLKVDWEGAGYLPCRLRRIPAQLEELARNPSLQLAATLLKAFAVDALLDTVKNVLRATDSAREQIELLPIWRSQPSADGLWL
jgi:hypothetical protein